MWGLNKTQKDKVGNFRSATNENETAAIDFLKKSKLGC